MATPARVAAPAPVATPAPVAAPARVATPAPVAAPSPAPPPVAAAPTPAPPPVAATPTPAPTPPAPPPAPRGAPAAPLTLRDTEEITRVWLRLLQPLPEAIRVQVHDVAVPLAVEGGRLRVGVRNELWRTRVRERLGELDLEGLVPGLRAFDVVFEAERGQTGREVIAVVEQERRAAARQAAEGSEAIKRLIQSFDGELDEVLPAVPADALAVPVVADLADDYAAGGGLDG